MPQNGAAPHAVIVGASLAGLRAAQAARAAGFSGRLTIVGAEPHMPYDRPPLSKTLLTGEIPIQATALPIAPGLGAKWQLGTPAARLDRTRRELHLADGRTIAYDRLLIATGARARPWPNQRERALSGVHTLRDRDDAERLRNAFVELPERVVVVGAGFAGSEVAHAARRRGLPVTLVERAEAPFTRVLGEQLGTVVGSLLEAAGVELRLHAQVRRLEDDGKGRVIRVLLTSGESFDTPCVVAALGLKRNTDWLEGSGLSFDANGLDCDGATRALDADGTPDESVFVAGDVARFPHPLYGRIALEHWSHAAAQGAHAGAMLAGAMPAGSAPPGPYDALPSFWTIQGGYEIRAVGLTEGADGIAFAEGSTKAGRFVVVYGRAGLCIAALSFAMPEALPPYAALIAARAPFPPRRGLAVLPPDFV